MLAERFGGALLFGVHFIGPPRTGISPTGEHLGCCVVKLLHGDPTAFGFDGGLDHGHLTTAHLGFKHLD